MQVTVPSSVHRYKDLVISWAARTIQARYQQSLLGGLWAILQPAATVVIFSFIFTRLVPINTGDIPYLVFSYTAMVPWTFFSSSIGEMVEVLIINMNLVTKIYFPREILLIAVTLSRLLDFIIAGLVLILLILVYKIPIYPPGWLLLPFVVLVQILLMLGIGLISAALNVFYRDIKHIVVLGLQLWLYASPIIYPASIVPMRLRSLYYLNPMAGIIESYRSILLYQQPPGMFLLVATLISLATFAFGLWFFKKLEFQFADVI